jgi:hypothetical protein
MLKILSVIIFICIFVGNVVIAQHFNCVETDEGVLLLHDHQNIYFYQKVTKSRQGEYPRANYIHPLYGLYGEILTEDFPEDHLHHRGIFWAWHQLYVEGEKAGDGWECRGITWNVQNISEETGSETAKLHLELTWDGELAGKPASLIKEETIITCRKPDEHMVQLDFDIRLTALHEGTRIGGSEDAKGYSGFSIRTKLPEDIRFYSVLGELTPIETAIKAGGWVTMRGNFIPRQQNQTAITIMCNPDDPTPFHGWILRSRGSMQNAAFPGRDPVPVPVNESLRMRYSILLHRPDLGFHVIDGIHKEFLKNK